MSSLILRVELPELQVRKAIKIYRNEPLLPSIAKQLMKKASNHQEMQQVLKNCRLYRIKYDCYISGDCSLDELPGPQWQDNDTIQLQVRNHKAELVTQLQSGHVQSAPHKKITAQSTLKKLTKIAHKTLSMEHGQVKQLREPTFGVDLIDVPFVDGTEIPVVVYILLDYIRRNDMTTEGIFRLSGASTTVQKIKLFFDTENVRNFDSQDLIKRGVIKQGDGHAVAGALKLFLRELPDPLLPFEYYDAFMAASGMRQLHSVVEMLPTVNKMLLRYLIEFFSDLAQQSEWNKMPFQNIATVMAPNILRQKTESMHEMVQNAGLVNKVTLDLLQLYGSSSATNFEAHVQLCNRAVVGLASALYPYDTQNVAVDFNGFKEVSFDKSSLFFVYGEPESHEFNYKQDGWWVCEMLGSGTVGIVPSNFLKVLVRSEGVQDKVPDDEPPSYESTHSVVTDESQQTVTSQVHSVDIYGKDIVVSARSSIVSITPSVTPRLYEDKFTQTDSYLPDLEAQVVRLQAQLTASRLQLSRLGVESKLSEPILISPPKSPLVDSQKKRSSVVSVKRRPPPAVPTQYPPIRKEHLHSLLLDDILTRRVLEYQEDPFSMPRTLQRQVAPQDEVELPPPLI